MPVGVCHSRRDPRLSNTFQDAPGRHPEPWRVVRRAYARAQPPRAAPDVPCRLTKAARTTSFAWLRGLTEESARQWFTDIRFRDNGGAPVCPACGGTKHYGLKTRPGWWKCARKTCRKQFSATSGTIFHSRKLSFLKLVTLVFHFADCAKGTSACELSLKFETDYKTVWVNLMKLREAMSSRREAAVLEGAVEMDAAYFGGKVRQKNEVDERRKVDRRRAEFQKGKRAVMVVCQRDGDAVMFAADDESAEVANAAAARLVRITPETRLVTDQSGAYGDLEALAPHDTIDHSKRFSKDGVSTNQAESAFSRARRAEFGTYHHWSPTWLDFYAGEMSWRQNRRRTGNKLQAEDIVALECAIPQSRDLKGYWQHHELPDDQLKRAEVRWTRVHGRPRRP